MSTLPRTFKKLQATAISSKFRCSLLITDQIFRYFREVTKIVEENLPVPGPNEVLVRNHFVGINASDINYTNGQYVKNLKPPFDVGFEAVGEIVALGAGVERWREGQAVLVLGYGAFGQYVRAHVRQLAAVRGVRAEWLALPVSALTAALALTEARVRPGERVLVTAAAGATGLVAVQLAKLAGAHVVATCSSPAKAVRLRALGADRVVNYRAEDLATVLRAEYPRGIDVVYESVGGATFDACLDALAVRGRLLVIGAISGYRDGSAFARGTSESGARAPLPTRLLAKSASLVGFFLNHYAAQQPQQLARLMDLVEAGKLQLVVDQRHFVGLESIADALDYMYSGQNLGKVVVDLRPPAAKL